MLIDESLLEGLMEQAAESERRRMNFDLRTGTGDGSQRMLNALLPGTVVPIHRHRDTAETVIVLSGRLTEVFYEVEEAGAALDEPSCEDAAPCEEMACGAEAAAGVHEEASRCSSALATLASGAAVRVRELARHNLDPAAGRYGIQIPKGVWHTVIAYEPGILFEAKDGAFHPALPEDMIPPHATAQILASTEVS